MLKMFDLSGSPAIDFQIIGRGKVTTEIHSFLCMCENFNKLLKVLINVHAEMIGDLRGAVEAYGDENLLRSVGREKLCKEIVAVLKEISRATALDTEEISQILAKNPSASIADVSFHLHRRSLIDRSYTS